jgi:hypothetical protein
MIVKNTGISKVVKLNGILKVVNPGINIFEDSNRLRNIIAGHKDLSIITVIEKPTTTTAKPEIKKIIEKVKKLGRKPLDRINKEEQK